MEILLSIPVRSHLKKWLVGKYGSKHVVTKKTAIGLLLLSMLDKKIEKPKKLASEYPERYEIVITQRYFNINGFEIGHNRKRFLSELLERLFKDDLNCFVDMAIIRGNSTAYEAIRQFLKHYDICENDLKLESVYRNYQRYSKESIRAKKGTIKVDFAPQFRATA
ncbi:hypothetical protein [Flavobacterium sp.]|uniref:hypothetical protein n=1 Tax=Flavobacterium sp. TaxID=239 RepID=UPI0012285B7C|nr:hypothetical protein [Flavobacterium sp.]RZJ71095.1 MAG: hypothetical protein EOO49_11620 [Flavobacterium sp.]